jgi:molecular chaperone DnaK
MTNHKAIGIDLGTTNSCVAWVDETGHTAMVRNAEGDLLTPSMVLFDDAEVVVGKEARNACVVEPSRVAIWVKRDMGAPVYSRPIRGEYLPPEVIQACILRKLRSDVVHALGPESQVVITVPAYFDEPRRKATADAGEMAGLKVLDIVNEPTAGALAFGEVLGYLSPDSAPQKSLTVLVYDLGGGTFDSTLLRLSPGNIQMIATDGDVQLGGYDWDMRLVAHVAEAFKRTHGVDPRNDASAANRLFREVVDAKHTLSSRSHAKIRLDHADKHFECDVERQAFEEMTADLLERTAYTTRQLLAAAKLDWKDVDRVLLVGGSTRMPMVSRMLEQLSGLRPDHTVNPDEAVARGAALYAHYLLSKTTPGATPASFEVGNVNAHSLGIEGIEAETLRKRNVILIPRNTPLPAKVTQRFATKTEGQRSIVVQVLEGESSLPSECTAIGQTTIRNLPAGLAKGWPVEVTFEYGTNGRLSVHASVTGTLRETLLELERETGLSRDGLTRWQEVLSSRGAFKDYERAMAEVKRTAGPSAAKPTEADGWALPPLPTSSAPAAATVPLHRTPPHVTPPPHATPPVSPQPLNVTPPHVTPPLHATPPAIATPPMAPRPEASPAVPIATPPTPGVFAGAVMTPPAQPPASQPAASSPPGPAVGQAFGWSGPGMPAVGPQPMAGYPGAPQHADPYPAWQPATTTWQSPAGVGGQQPMAPAGWPPQSPWPGAAPGYPMAPMPGGYPMGPYGNPAPQPMGMGQPGYPPAADPWAGQAPYGYGYGQQPAPAYFDPGMNAAEDFRRPERSIARTIINVVGHIMAAGLGLLVGYLFLAWLRPDLALLHWMPFR